MDDSEAEMGRTLDEFIASLPNDQQDQIEARYQLLRQDYSTSLGDRTPGEASVKGSRKSRSASTRPSRNS
jgi:hypothetical protein